MFKRTPHIYWASNASGKSIDHISKYRIGDTQNGQEVCDVDE